MAVSLSVPTPDADAFYGYGLHGYGYGHPIAPVAYHVPACKTVENTITHKVCTPKTEEKCEDVTYKTIVSTNNLKTLKVTLFLLNENICSAL